MRWLNGWLANHRLTLSRTWLALDRLSSRSTCSTGCTKFGATCTRRHGHHLIDFIRVSCEGLHSLFSVPRACEPGRREDSTKVEAAMAFRVSSTIFRHWRH